MDKTPIYKLDAIVYADGTFDIQEHNQHSVGFKKSRDALIVLRNELNRLIDSGPYLCPHAKRAG